MTYQEILERVNHYLIIIGVRDFCQRICTDRECTNPLLQCPNAFENHDSAICATKLPCALYLCDYVEAHIINYVENGEQIVDLLREVDLIVRKKIMDIEQTHLVYAISSENHKNLVFTIPDITLLLNPTRQEVFANANTN